jgi:hypothetical protein
LPYRAIFYLISAIELRTVRMVRLRSYFSRESDEIYFKIKLPIIVGLVDRIRIIIRAAYVLGCHDLQMTFRDY